MIFAPGTFNAATYTTGVFAPGGLSPEGIIRHEAARRLAASAKLSAIVGGRLNAAADLTNIEIGAFPQLWVTLEANQILEAIGPLDKNQIRVFAILRYELTSNARVLSYGQPDVPEALGLVRRIWNAHGTADGVDTDPDGHAANNKMLPVLLGNGAVPSLARDSNPEPPEFRPVQLSETKWAGYAVQPWVYNVFVNHNTGHIQSLDDSGAYA